VTRHELRTGRLLLRAWRAQDRELFAAMNADPRVMRWFPSVQTRAESDAMVDRFARIHEERGYTCWAVQVLDSAHGPAPFVGFVGLVPPSFDPPFTHADPCVEIGWRLAAQWWGLGLATEAADAALRWGLTQAGLAEIVSFTVPPNLASQAVMQRIGMRYDGTFEHPRGAGRWWGSHTLYRATEADLA